MVMPPGTKAGDVYNGITAIRFDHNDSKGNQYWLFRCRCGREWVCRASLVRCNHTTSCGQGECQPAFHHGLTCAGSRYKKEYAALCNALSQCYNTNDQYYAEAGAKGIKVCGRWRSSFENFLADVGRCPNGKRFLQRIDRRKDFKRGNVRWANEMELGCHRKNNRWITLDGITLHLSEWSRVTGIKTGTLSRRVLHGWSEVEALTTPIGQPKGNYQCQWRQDRVKLIDLAKRNFQTSWVAIHKRRTS